MCRLYPRKPGGCRQQKRRKVQSYFTMGKNNKDSRESLLRCAFLNKNKNDMRLKYSLMIAKQLLLDHGPLLSIQSQRCQTFGCLNRHTVHIQRVFQCVAHDKDNTLQFVAHGSDRVFDIEFIQQNNSNCSKQGDVFFVCSVENVLENRMHLQNARTVALDNFAKLGRNRPQDKHAQWFCNVCQYKNWWNENWQDVQDFDAFLQDEYLRDWYVRKLHALCEKYRILKEKVEESRREKKTQNYVPQEVIPQQYRKQCSQCAAFVHCSKTTLVDEKRFFCIPCTALCQICRRRRPQSELAADAFCFMCSGILRQIEVWYVTQCEKLPCVAQKCF